MSIFREGKYRAHCEACRIPFDPVEGGVCAKCGRILCADHLYGGLLRRMLAVVGAKAVCVRCREGG